MPVSKINLLKYAITPVVLLGSCQQGTVSEKPGFKPNIVFVLADDLGWADVGYNGATFYETPNIDRLASEGIVFNRDRKSVV